MSTRQVLVLTKDSVLRAHTAIEAGVHEAMIHTPLVFDSMLYLTGEAPTSCWGAVTLDGRPATRDDARDVEYLGAGPMAGVLWRVWQEGAARDAE